MVASVVRECLTSLMFLSWYHEDLHMVVIWVVMLMLASNITPMLRADSDGVTSEVPTRIVGSDILLWLLLGVIRITSVLSSLSFKNELTSTFLFLRYNFKFADGLLRVPRHCQLKKYKKAGYHPHIGGKRLHDGDIFHLEGLCKE